MAGLCEGGNEPSGSLKAIFMSYVRVCLCWIKDDDDDDDDDNDDGDDDDIVVDDDDDFNDWKDVVSDIDFYVADTVAADDALDVPAADNGNDDAVVPAAAADFVPAAADDLVPPAADDNDDDAVVPAADNKDIVVPAADDDEDDAAAVFVAADDVRH
ncbi:hypothetical protein ANN_19033 [Periplaneta americana]|uniref:Uncharacterized protein n=1 Tax=Periplaneta americana TaxID=6978 RepID=A0ABQ8SRN3_PERAM|nr:hypothetical protein ANN_19033 [Periplaneta americana]